MASEYNYLGHTLWLPRKKKLLPMSSSHRASCPAPRRRTSSPRPRRKVLQYSEAQAKAKETLEAAKETGPAAPQPNEHFVPIRVFKDNDKYKDDVFVAVK